MLRTVFLDPIAPTIVFSLGSRTRNAEHGEYQPQQEFECIIATLF
jgi:hypothetical protein